MADEVKKYTIGVCAMEKKTSSQPMTEILAKLMRKMSSEFQLLIFGDRLILDEPIAHWPYVDVLLSFYSENFPLQKAVDYVHLKKPLYVLNDLQEQFLLFDRRQIYQMLQRYQVPVPKHAIVERENGRTHHTVVEKENYIEINGSRINKPFVEKPINAEDHGVYIYYPMSAGGGSKRLFRKIGNRSSEFYPNHHSIRRSGSFLYEEFLNTQGTDIKVYTVGSNYAHAEARKSPALDGKVMRDSQGKEVRYPVILNSAEKDIARKVCTAFKQTVCGFDFLRVGGRSYVCDVNGWSFVKNSKKYYEDCSLILANLITRHITGDMRQRRSTVSSSGSHDDGECSQSSSFHSASDLMEDSIFDEIVENEKMNPNLKKNEELRCLIGIIRHGDRTPKQKLKMKVWHPSLIEYYWNHISCKSIDNPKQLKVKSVIDLQELLKLIKHIIDQYDNMVDKTVEEKQQIWCKNGGNSLKKIYEMCDVLERWKFSGINRKVQFKPNLIKKKNTSNNNSVELLLVCKWGGDLTPIGRMQGEKLGRVIRQHFYPIKEGNILRLHSTFRHDLKIYTSDEGRVQMTAAAFAKGFLALEGELTPILVSLITTLQKDANKMLDHSGQADADDEMNKIKSKLSDFFSREYSSISELEHAIAPRGNSSIISALKELENPREKIRELYDLVELFYVQLKHALSALDNDNLLYMGEPANLMCQRWEKLVHDFLVVNSNFNLSKLPDIYDMIKYDLAHNTKLLMEISCTQKLYNLAKCFASCYVPQEYGIEQCEKSKIGATVCQALCEKLLMDVATAMSISYGDNQIIKPIMQDSFTEDAEDTEEEIQYRLDPSFAKERRVSRPDKQVRSRLYFTSESHLHTLLNLLSIYLNQSVNTPEIDYMSHIIIRLFENPTAQDTSSQFRVEIGFCSGIADLDKSLEEIASSKENLVEFAPMINLTNSLPGNMFEDMLKSFVAPETDFTTCE